MSRSYGGLHANQTPTSRRGRQGGRADRAERGRQDDAIDASPGSPGQRRPSGLDGVDLAGKTPDRRAHLGLSRTFQSLQLFEDLTVRGRPRPPPRVPRWHSFLGDASRPGHKRAPVLRTGRPALACSAPADWRDVPDGPQRRSTQADRRGAGAQRTPSRAPRPAAAGLDTAESQLLGAHLRELPRAACRCSSSTTTWDSC